MRYRYLYIICLLIFCIACDKQEMDTTTSPVTQQGEPLSINIATKSGEPELPAKASDFYGMYCIEHSSGQAGSWYNPAPMSFYSGLQNIKGYISGGKLFFDSDASYNPSNPFRYPINDSLSVFLYYPYEPGAQFNNFTVGRQKKTESDGTVIADKYPDYIAGTKAISVVGGTPQNWGDASVTMKHLMARVRFRIKNPGTDPITLTEVRLMGIPWTGTINPHITDANDGFFTATAPATDVLTLIKEFPATGGELNMQIDSIYNYCDEEVSAGTAYNGNYKYYLLVPPLSASALANAKLEIDFIRHGTSYTVTVEMTQIKINEWQPGRSHCYTIAFNTYMIDYVDTFIEPWIEDTYSGSINLQEDNG